MKWVSEDPSYITGGELEYPRELFLGRNPKALQVTDTGCRLFPEQRQHYQQLVAGWQPKIQRKFWKTSRDRYGYNGVSDPIGGLVFKGSSGTGLLPSSRVDLTGDEDPTNKDGDIGMGDSTGVSISLGGEISSGGKKSQELNIGDTRDEDTTVGRAIGA
ncbi:hypothetical protein Tco_1019800 [Tanacetum coccineum]|uniref:Uncharacterized protein n=1 Tax=Tanacetum coccineum TaxID=301880 RepID=A0ABQ5FYG6_9ASTR